MVRLPDEFHDEYDNRGETFFDLAELLYANHGREFTQGDLADDLGVSNSRVSDFTTRLTEDGWINRHESRTTFDWNTEAHNPATTEMTDAVVGFYRDISAVFSRHTNTMTGMFTVIGYVLLVATGVLWALYVGIRFGLANNSVIPITGYVVLGVLLGASGVVMTAFVPLVAVGNRLGNRLLRSWIEESNESE